jgi:hypothetical protein
MPPPVWIVPGAPLEGGRGWRIWYSRPGRDVFRPGQIDVSRNGRPEPISVDDPPWTLFDPVEGLDRRMGVLTVELAEPHPGDEYELHIPELGSSQPVRWRTLPDSIDGGLTFLLSSCFWLPNDKEGAYGAGVRELTKLTSPAFKLLIGDQLYQDYPFNWFMPGSAFSLYAGRYEQYWGNSAYQEVLRATPNYFLCDDHEFWNDFPEAQIQLGRTWDDDSRARCEHAARTLYWLYQQVVNPNQATFYRFDIGCVSFFVADSRSKRTKFDIDSPHFFGDDQWQALTTWAEELSGPGVLVLGQPLFQREGDWKDHSLSNFSEDYGRLCGLLEEVLTGAEGKRHDVLILTGDIHNGRYTVATVAGLTAPPNVHEFVASPASRVGPYLKQPTPQKPPTKFNVTHGGPPTTWTVLEDVSETVPTVDNNVATIKVSPGTLGTVRFELTIWRIRPYDSRSTFGRAFHRPQPQGSLIPLYRKEIQLQ